MSSLRELRLEPEREDQLLQLALVAPLGREQQRLHDLLGDRAAALHDAMVLDRLATSARTMLERVDAAVAVEVGVLGGEEGVAHVRRDAVERHEVAPLDVELADQRAVVGEDAGRDRRLVAQELVDRRQVGRDLAVEHEARDAAGEQHRDRGPEDEPPERTPADVAPVPSCATRTLPARPSDGQSSGRDPGRVRAG